MNKDIEHALLFADSQVSSKRILTNKKVLSFWDNKSTLFWKDLCEFSALTILGTHPIKVTLSMLIFFLDNGLYCDQYSEKLYSDLPLLKECLESFCSYDKAIFTDNYDECYIIKKIDQKSPHIISLPNTNPIFTALVIDFIKDQTTTIGYLNDAIIYQFAQSIQDAKLSSYKDINSLLFWAQIDYFKNLYKNNSKACDAAIQYVCKFYRWLVVKYSTFDFFESSNSLTKELVLSNALVKNIKKNAYFTLFSSTEDLEDKPFIVFILKNLESHSTNLVKNDHFILNSSILKTAYYRKIVNKYVQNITAISMLTWTGQEIYIIDILHFLEEIKKQNGYPNANLYYLNTKEAILVKKYFETSKSEISLPTLNNKIGAVRRFFQWCQKCGFMSFDNTFFDYLSQYEEPNKFQGESIPDHDLEKINKKFIELSKQDTFYKAIYGIFLILLETEFRVAQVCNLTTSSIQPTLKEDQYSIYSNTKTSVGRKISQPICLATKHILESVIDDTEALRNEVILDSYKDHIFLYKNYHKTIKAITPSVFLTSFKKVCSISGVEPYHSRNIRDTHMTKAFEFILKNGKSDLEMGLLSKHTHIDTTKNHYIEMELTKMFESTYQVTLGNRDINQYSRILDKIPDNINNDDSIVENGCGHCKATICQISGNLPCLICSDFITTVGHKEYFIKMIDNCDRLIKISKIPHEIEDLIIMKTLYINWLREICLKEEENK